MASEHYRRNGNRMDIALYRLTHAVFEVNRRTVTAASFIMMITTAAIAASFEFPDAYLMLLPLVLLLVVGILLVM